MLKKQIALQGLPCISLSLNVPGFPKSNPTANAFFRLCLRELKYDLKAHLVDIQIPSTIETIDAAGDLFIAPISQGGQSLKGLKQICENFEATHLLGRFLDVDLNDAFGNTVSSGKSKLCFYCHEKPAIECRRENAHELQLLRDFMFSKMAEYVRQQREDAIIRQLSSLGLKSLLYEISLTPKPGLVDKFSNGSHGDMNYLTFIDSTSAISSCFGNLIRAGFSFQDNDLTKALPIIRNIGLRMESAMNEATRNVNTQKGIIFLMGISLFASGMLFGKSDQFDMKQFRFIICSICRDMVHNELIHFTQTQKSHGEDIFLKHGFSGARGEAESGLQTVFEFGLPQLTGLPKLNDEAMIKCFLAIASNNADTNILYRGGPKVLATFEELCKKALDDFNDLNYSEVINYCKKENISPGGSADLLAVTIFVWSIMNDSFFTNLFKINDF